jgi:hypothetical protein
MRFFTHITVLIILNFYNLIFAQNIENEVITGIEIYSGSEYNHLIFGKSPEVNQNSFSATCFKNISKLNGVWLKYNAIEDGVLSIKITPVRLTDDIDFVIYKSVNNDLLHLEEIACSSAGPILSNFEYHKSNLGVTGAFELSDEDNSNIFTEISNILQPIFIESNYTYYILVLNYESTLGFSIELDDRQITPTEPDVKVGNEMELTIYPNPVGSLLNINIKPVKNVDHLVVTVYNLNSVPVLRSKTQNLRSYEQTNLQFDLTSLLPSTYIVEFKDKDHVVYRKFIKL